jgi:hypothetical protein
MVCSRSVSTRPWRMGGGVGARGLGSGWSMLWRSASAAWYDSSCSMARAW